MPSCALPWHVITCEYPPLVGGVADFTRTITRALAASGETVHVWSPEPASDESGIITLHPLKGGYRVAALRALDQALERTPTPRRLFVQWVPHGYGYKSLNVAFCGWVAARVRRGDSVDLMVHEPYLPFERGRWRQNAGAAVHRAMLMLLLRVATRVWVSTPSFGDLVIPFGPRGMATPAWLPVPSPIVRVHAPADVQARRARLANAQPTVGYFGACNALVAPLLASAFAAIVARRPDVRVLLFGRGTTAFAERLVLEHPACASSLMALGELPAGELSQCIQGVDVFVQPYPDGVSSRRTTLMALLQHGCAVVSTSGSRSEHWWATSNAVRLTARDAADIARATVSLLDAPDERTRLGSEALALYDTRFDVRHALAALRASPPGAGWPCRPVA